MAKVNKLYDVLIIGAGPAGLTAAVYAGRADKKVAVIDKDGFGGNIAKSPRVENIPGFASVSGAEFMESLYKQATSYPTVKDYMGKAVFIEYRRGIFMVTVDSGEPEKTVLCGLSLIFATGTEHRKSQLKTDNLHYCVTCDGPFYKDKTVIVAGAGNTGATYALDLATYCKDVYLCDIAMEMPCEAVLRKAIKKKRNIHWLPNCYIAFVNNDKDKKLESVTLSTASIIKCDAVFMAIGVTPQTDIVGQFASLDKDGYIVSEDCGTDKVPGVFAAGDCRTGKVKQVVTAAADGAVAALKAIEYVNWLNRLKSPK